jgi:hypothetical protein
VFNVIVVPISPDITVYVGVVNVPVDDVKQSASTNVALLLVVYTFPLLSGAEQEDKSSISTYIVFPVYKVYVPLDVFVLVSTTEPLTYILISPFAPPVSLYDQDKVDVDTTLVGVGDGVGVTVGVGVLVGVTVGVGVGVGVIVGVGVGVIGSGGTGTSHCCGPKLFANSSCMSSTNSVCKLQKISTGGIGLIDDISTFNNLINSTLFD